MTRHVWSDVETAELACRYPDERTDRIAADLGLDMHRVYGKANRMGLRKSAAFLASPDSGWITKGDPRGVGGAGRFKPGNTAWNKGTRYQPGGRCAETQFRPGERRGVAVTLYQPIGTERVTDDGTLQRKVNDDNPPHRRWQSVHSLVWIAEHGPIPAGHVVVFRPGMATAEADEITLDRLELVTRAELMRRNTIHRYPAEIKSAMKLIGKLRRTIDAREEH